MLCPSPKQTEDRQLNLDGAKNYPVKKNEKKGEEKKEEEEKKKI